MPDFRALAARMFLGQPQAYSRVTRTPIYKGNLPEGQGAEYHDERLLPGYITAPDLNQMSPQLIRHEQAHAIYDQAGLSRMGSDLAKRVPESTQNLLRSNTLYNGNINDKTVSNEGLGFAIGNPNDAGYVNYVASKIQDPAQRARLLRLQSLSGIK